MLSCVVFGGVTNEIVFWKVEEAKGIPFSPTLIENVQFPY